MSLQLGERVWERGYSSGVAELSRQAYTFAVSGFTVYGMILASIVAFLCLSWQPGWILFLLVGLGIPIAGIIIAFKYDHWLLSLSGYTMVVVGMGAICGPTVALFDTGVVMNALVATCGVTIVMSIIGIVVRRSLEHWGGYLFGILVVVVLVSIARLFFPVSMDAPGPNVKGMAILLYYLWLVFDYLVAILFCFYIIYDWNRALRIPWTLDNAVDCAMAIFLDVINLFVRILSIMGRRK